MRDLCEIILTHGFLFDGEGTVIGAHNVESVTEGHTESNVQSQLHREGRIERNKCIFDKTNSLYILSQKAHQEIGRGWVHTKRRHSDMSGGEGPVLVIVLCTIQHCVGCGGLSVDHFTCGETRVRQLVL